MDVTDIQYDQCCGCSGCMSSCNVGAISMTKNEQGFLVPIIDEEKCVKCGLCYSVCIHSVYSKKSTIAAYAARNINIEVLEKSSSGGVSHALAKEVIDMGGVVYGVAYSNDYKVITMRAENMSECEKFYGSKYVQTDPANTFREVYKDLVNQRVVLYIGTSCHIAGLLSFLNSKKCNIDYLYTVDLICHGVPSPLIFQEYIDLLKKNKKFKGFEFRTKTHPWGFGSKNYGCTIFYDNRQEIDTSKSKLFLKLFFSNNCLRDVCHQCKYIGSEKPSDITIADYWGIKEEHPLFYSEKGVSAVLVHTQKGDKLLHACDELSLLVSSLEKIEKKQGNMHSPSIINPDSTSFWNLYKQKGFMAIAKKYGNYALKTRIKYYVRHLIHSEG